MPVSNRIEDNRIQDISYLRGMYPKIHFFAEDFGQEKGFEPNPVMVQMVKHWIDTREELLGNLGGIWFTEKHTAGGAVDYEISESERNGFITLGLFGVMRPYLQGEKFFPSNIFRIFDHEFGHTRDSLSLKDINSNNWVRYESIVQSVEKAIRESPELKAQFGAIRNSIGTLTSKQRASVLNKIGVFLRGETAVVIDGKTKHSYLLYDDVKHLSAENVFDDLSNSLTSLAQGNKPKLTEPEIESLLAIASRDFKGNPIKTISDDFNKLREVLNENIGISYFYQIHRRPIHANGAPVELVTMFIDRDDTDLQKRLSSDKPTVRELNKKLLDLAYGNKQMTGQRYQKLLGYYNEKNEIQ